MLDDRQGQGATLITSQFPVNQWHEVIADPTVADAILDRLVHNAYRIELKGESMRKGKTPPSEMKTNLPQSKARLFGRAGESVTRSDRRQPELEFGSWLPPLTARPNRRRDDVFGWRVKASPLEGAPNEGKTAAKS
jgi:hypothetical protein